jgi:hypothetical protein
MSRLVACLAVLLIASACAGGNADRVPSARVSKSPHSTVRSNTEPPPEMPRVAKANSLAGANAFASYFLEVHNYAMRTGRTDELRRVTAPECFTCLATPALIESTYRSGGRIAGGQWIPMTNVFSETNYPGGRFPKGHGFFNVSIHIQPMTTFAGHDRIIGTYAGSNHDRYLSISTSWRAGQWYVDQLIGAAGQQL